MRHPWPNSGVSCPCKPLYSVSHPFGGWVPSFCLPARSGNPGKGGGKPRALSYRFLPGHVLCWATGWLPDELPLSPRLTLLPPFPVPLPGLPVTLVFLEVASCRACVSPQVFLMPLSPGHPSLLCCSLLAAVVGWGRAPQRLHMADLPGENCQPTILYQNMLDSKIE